MEVSNRTDPYRSYNFRVEFDGQDVGSFSEVSGLSSQGDAVDYREGTDAFMSPRKLIGLRTFGTVTLRRGVTASTVLWDWYARIVNGLTDRRDGAVVLRNEEGADVMRWTLYGAFVNSYEGPSFNAANSEVAIEAVEIVPERIVLELEA